MRLTALLVILLAIAGSTVALHPSAPAAATLPNVRACGVEASCAIAQATAGTDALAARFHALPRGIDGVKAAVETTLDVAGDHLAPLVATHSASLEAAILRVYAASDITVTPALAAKVHAQAPRADTPALRELFDAFADAQLASAKIMSPADRAALSHDLANTMKTITLRPDSPEAKKAEALLARADLTQAAAAAIRLSSVIPRLPDLVPITDCSRIIDLPLIQVGAPCNDDYPADDTDLILIDYGGDDTYENNVGGGIAGVGAGLGIDYGNGGDVYRTTSFAQGASIAGVGILYDEGGADLYNITNFGQGFSAGGFAMLYDGGASDDIYESPNDPSSLGTKAGGLGGVGVLVDEGGKDTFQQDGLDGFIYGGQGAGILLNFGQDDDQYISRDLEITLAVDPTGLGLVPPEDLGSFVGPIQVSAEVNGIAILYEEGGNDIYSCGDHVRQGCQAAGGIGATALLLDMSGDDTYRLGQTVTPTLADATGVGELSIIPSFPSGQGVAYGEGSAPPGGGLGILRDVSGDDQYIATAFAQGYATGGVGLLIDDAGHDTYTAGTPLVGTRADGGTWVDGIALGVGVDRA